jgi:2-polyprenyl-6-methoxyphenol hydroxylase-like FAD-dependent oxidoreductase
VEAIEQHGAVARLRCASGAVFDASLVVGADGVHSLVRDWVCGADQPLYSGTSGFAGWFRPATCASFPTRERCSSGWARARICCTIQSTAAA